MAAVPFVRPDRGTVLNHHTDRNERDEKDMGGEHDQTEVKV